MVKGINKFKEWFKENQNQYVIIGGSACDILMSEEGLDFRSTKDIDLVLIVETIDSNFGKNFWNYIQEGKYEFCNRSTGLPQFYRFTHPKSDDFPIMIELFSRSLDDIFLPEEAVLTPIPFEEEISSLSAILLDDDYYQFLTEGKIIVSEVSILKAEYLIPFKAKAWLDLCIRKENGEHVDSKNIKKHRNDVFRLYEIINPSSQIKTSEIILNDLHEFIEKMRDEDIHLNQLGIHSITKDEILDELNRIYISKVNS